MKLFYTPDVAGEYHSLKEEESKHIVKVLRLKEGDCIHLTDGIGNLYQCEIQLAHPKSCELKIIHHTSDYEKRDFYLKIAIAPTKNNNRTEWFLEKATEMGIDCFSMMKSENSERKHVKTDRLNKIITSAMKQSLKAYHPVLEDIKEFEEIIDMSFEGKKLIAYCDDKPNLHLQHQIAKGDSVLVLIGPEGDFTPEEVEKAIEKGFIPVNLGKSRLRTETAALMACAIVNLINYEGQ